MGVSKDLTIGEGAIVLAKSGVGKTLKGNTTYFGIPVSEAREKMRDLANIKRIPDILDTVYKRDKK